MKAARKFEREVDLCAAFVAAAPRGWKLYPEWAGWDILAVRVADGVQIGIEAKLSLNVKVVTQALPSWLGADIGPDFRAVLVPSGSTQIGLKEICVALGIVVVEMRDFGHGLEIHPDLPTPQTIRYQRDWHEWAPASRHRLPDYVPDVTAGASAPMQLTDWKIRAIKLAILLETRPLLRRDFKAAGVSAARWTCPHTGWLTPTPEGYVAGARMPDFRVQHPLNWEEIKADILKWDWSGAALI